jgi:predicted nucleic acid-binding protein
MEDKVFIDTNIFVYSILQDDKTGKSIKSNQLLENMQEKIIISTQVINEYYNTLLKYKIEESLIQSYILGILDEAVLSIIQMETIYRSWEIRKKHKYSYYDCLIIASALENQCSILYSEDMQNGQLIEDKLKIKNPFL